MSSNIVGDGNSVNDIQTAVKKPLALTGRGFFSR